MGHLGFIAEEQLICRKIRVGTSEDVGLRVVAHRLDDVFKRDIINLKSKHKEVKDSLVAVEVSLHESGHVISVIQAIVVCKVACHALRLDEIKRSNAVSVVFKWDIESDEPIVTPVDNRILNRGVWVIRKHIQRILGNTGASPLKKREGIVSAVHFIRASIFGRNKPALLHERVPERGWVRCVVERVSLCLCHSCGGLEVREILAPVPHASDPRHQLSHIQEIVLRANCRSGSRVDYDREHEGLAV